MLKNIFRFLILFAALSVTAWFLIHYTDMDFGHSNFWDKHGIFFLFFIALFPRLTLLFSSVPFGGLLWWLGFFFAPRLLVAILATVAYWNQNPILVTLSWLVALGGETSEKAVFINRPYRRRFFFHRTPKPKKDPNVIDVDYKIIDDKADK